MANSLYAPMLDFLYSTAAIPNRDIPGRICTGRSFVVGSKEISARVATGKTLLKTQITTQGLLSISKTANNAELQFGRHPLGVELNDLQPGSSRVSYYYPKMQSLVGWASKSFDLNPGIDTGDSGT